MATADKRSSLVQIAQAALDETAQSLKVSVVSGGGGTSDVNLAAEVSTGNSTTAPLGANGVFTGAAFDAKDFATLSISVISDASSITNGLSVQFSQDGTNWDHVHTYTYITSANGLSYNLPLEMRYVRIVYTNGAVAQTSFRLQSVLRRTQVPPSVYTLEQGVNDYTVASPTKSVIYGKTTGGGGGYVAVKVNPSGALTAETQTYGYLGRAILNYTSTNVNSTTWTQLLSSVGAQDVMEIEIFDSSGEILELGIGGSGSESGRVYVIPGGNGKIPFKIAKNTRLSIKAVSGTANSGYIVINLYG